MLQHQTSCQNASGLDSNLNNCERSQQFFFSRDGTVYLPHVNSRQNYRSKTKLFFIAVFAESYLAVVIFEMQYLEAMKCHLHLAFKGSFSSRVLSSRHVTAPKYDIVCARE